MGVTDGGSFRSGSPRRGRPGSRDVCGNRKVEIIKPKGAAPGNLTRFTGTLPNKFFTDPPPSRIAGF